MEGFFTVTGTEGQKEGKGGKIRLGIRLKIREQEVFCPVSGPCDSYEALKREVEEVRKDLDEALNRAREVLDRAGKKDGLALDSGMSPEGIWSILSAAGDEDLFVRGFNGLEEWKRREVAEYILTRCNIFSGRAAIFSSRYSDEFALME